MSASIDVVIPIFNGYELTERCLAALREQTVPHRVIVVDDGSTDGSAERLGSAWPTVSVVRLERNVGFAQACNRGVSEGESEFVVLLNNDVECRRDFLAQAIAPFASDARLGSVATLMLQPGSRLIDSIGMCCDPTLAGFLRLHGHDADRAGGARPVLAGAPGVAAAYRRAAWEQVGGLDERIFAYNEDFDLALRLRSAGWGAVASTSAAGVHLGSATYVHRSAFQRYHGGFGRGYVLRRYGVLRTRHALRALVTEAIVVVGDLAISRDPAALRGRLAGWRAASGCARLSYPPADCVEHAIGFRESLRLRRGAYGRRAV